MREEDLLRLELLTDRFALAPDSLSREDLNALEALLEVMATDTEVPEARRLVSVLTRATVAWWRVKHEQDSEPA